MADIQMSKTHHLGKDEMKKRCAAILERMKGRVDVKMAWDGDVCTFSGPADGKLTVLDDRIDVEVKLGFAVRLFKGKIESKLQESLERLVA